MVPELGKSVETTPFPAAVMSVAIEVVVTGETAQALIATLVLP